MDFDASSFLNKSGAASVTGNRYDSSLYTSHILNADPTDVFSESE